MKTRVQVGNRRLITLIILRAVGLLAAVSLQAQTGIPHFTMQPVSRTVLQNSNVTLNVSVTGDQPIACQWRLNNVAIDGATNTALAITNAQLSNEGYYSVVASNAVGVTPSLNAFLDVIDMPQALGPTNLVWINSSAQPWFVQSTSTHDGIAAAGVGPLTYGTSSILQTTVTGPGAVSFWWRTPRSDASLSFAADGLVLEDSHNISYGGWLQYTVYVGSGGHILTWTCINNWSPGGGVGQAFLDQVTFTPGVTAPSITVQPASRTNAAGTAASFSVAAVGTPTLNYQWRFNGTNLTGKTSATLSLNNVQANDAGNYSVTVSGPGGLAISSNALLVVTPSIPAITTQPVGSPVIIGGQVSMSVSASGTVPLSYQWLLNGVPLDGATNTSLNLSNVQVSDSGNYSVAITNSVGSAFSSNAVVSTYTMNDLSETLDWPAVSWITTNVPWFPQTNVTHDGVSAAQSGLISDTQQSTLQGTIIGPATVTYWWKVNCNGFWVNLAFVANGTVQSAIGGNVDWKQGTNYVGAGPQLIQWNLYPIHNFAGGGTGWVDRVEIIYEGTPVAIASHPANTTGVAGNGVSFSVAAIGTPPFRYQWQFNGNDIAEATNATLSLVNLQENNAGVYGVSVTNDFGSATSSNALLVVNPAAPTIVTQPVSQMKVIKSSASWSVTAKGSSPLTYQWCKEGVPIFGATTNAFSIPAVQYSDAGNYTVVVTNYYGSVTSAVAVLGVDSAIVIDLYASDPFGNSRFQYFGPSGDIIAVAAGTLHALALHSNGTVTAWGTSSFGVTSIPAGLSNVMAIAAGNNYCLALKADGTVVGWGDDTYGQCSSPMGLTNVTSIAAGPDFALALKDDGTVVGWGNDGNGQIDIPPGLTGVRAINAGYYYGFAIKTDGSFVQWGNGPVWQHNGTNTQLNVAPSSNNVVAIAAGGCSGWSLHDDGSVLAWGWSDGVTPYSNYMGTATGYIKSWSTSTNVHGQNRYSGMVALAACSSSPSDDHPMLLRFDGTFVQDRIPYGPGMQSYQISNVVAIAAGERHGVVLISDGTPRVVVPTINRIVSTSANVSFSCGVVGSFPLTYQWQFNGADLDGATNAWLSLSNVPLSATGDYHCIVSNELGCVTNHSATLSVLRSAPRFSDISFSNDGVSLNLQQLSGHGPVIIYASSNLIDWNPIATNPPVTGTFQFLDSSPTNVPAQFYRALEE